MTILVFVAIAVFGWVFRYCAVNQFYENRRVAQAVRAAENERIREFNEEYDAKERAAVARYNHLELNDDGYMDPLPEIELQLPYHDGAPTVVLVIVLWVVASYFASALICDGVHGPERYAEFLDVPHGGRKLIFVMLATSGLFVFHIEQYIELLRACYQRRKSSRATS